MRSTRNILQKICICSRIFPPCEYLRPFNGKSFLSNNSASAILEKFASGLVILALP
jgi:hypothetical protein